jgi:ABC-2 type transport system permease protein
VLERHDVRQDVTSERLSSLSPSTIKLLDELKENYDKAEVKRPVRIDAFISREVPDAYLPTRLAMLSTLQELKARGGDMLDVQINETEQFGPTVDTAKKRYGIVPRQVPSIVRGAISQNNNVVLGAAFTCGLEKVVLPFMEQTVPVEYEMVRSLSTVTQQKRKRLGILATDAQINGQMTMMGMSPSMSPPWRIVGELEKQYEVVPVPASRLITSEDDYVKAAFDFDVSDEDKMIQKGMELLDIKTSRREKLSKQEVDWCKAKVREAAKEKARLDVVLAVQPSSLPPEDMKRFIASIRFGQPTAIFEDPFPRFDRRIPGTSAPRRPTDQMQAMMNRGPMLKGNIKPLWKLLGVDFSGDDASDDTNDEFRPFRDAEGKGAADQIVWQRYNPYPKTGDAFEAEFVFVDKGCGAKTPFSQKDPISSGLQQVLFPFPGWIEMRNRSELEGRVFEPLVECGPNSGTVKQRDMFIPLPDGGMARNPYPTRTPAQGNGYMLAAHIGGRLPAAKGKGTNVNVVLVADLDMLTDAFFALRERGEIPELGIRFNFDNVTLVLNALDDLAGEQRLLELRKRRPQHRTLTRIEDRTENAKKEAIDAIEKSREDCEKATKKESDALREEMDKLEEQLKKGKNPDLAAVGQQVAMRLMTGQRRLEAQKEEREQKRDAEIREIENHKDAEIRRQQDQYKLWAVLLPPIPPLVLAGGVFCIRRIREREGVSRSRLR